MGGSCRLPFSRLNFKYCTCTHLTLYVYHCVVTINSYKTPYYINSTSYSTLYMYSYYTLNKDKLIAIPHPNTAVNTVPLHLNPYYSPIDRDSDDYNDYVRKPCKTLPTTIVLQNFTGGRLYNVPLVPDWPALGTAQHQRKGPRIWVNSWYVDFTVLQGSTLANMAPWCRVTVYLPKFPNYSGLNPGQLTISKPAGSTGSGSVWNDTNYYVLEDSIIPLAMQPYAAYNYTKVFTFDSHKSMLWSSISSYCFPIVVITCSPVATSTTYSKDYPGVIGYTMLSFTDL